MPCCLVSLERSSCRGNRVRPRLILVAEREPKFPRNLRPKLAKFIKSNIHRDVDSNILCRGPETSPRSGMIEVAERCSADFSQPFGKVRHGPAVIVVRNNGVRHGVQETSPCRPFPCPVVSRIFGKDCW